jgi:hypothetical protein
MQIQGVQPLYASVFTLMDTQGEEHHKAWQQSKGTNPPGCLLALGAGAICRRQGHRQAASLKVTKLECVDYWVDTSQ